MHQTNRFVAGSILWCLCASAQPAAKPEDKCSIEGTVVNAATGEPVKKARLLLTQLGATDKHPYSTTTDSAGHFVIDEVVAGPYDLLALHNGYSAQSYSLDGDPSHRTHLTLEAGQKLKEIVFKLRPNAVISGRILDEDGDPIENVTVECMAFEYTHGKKQLSAQASSITNDLGEFRMLVPRADKCLLKAAYQPQYRFDSVQERPIDGAHRDGGRYIATYYPNATNAANAVGLDVRPGAQISGISLTLTRTRAVSIKGHVNFGNPLCPSRTGVALFQGWLAMESTNDSTVDSQGVFTLKDVMPGSYVLQAGCFIDGKLNSARMQIDVRNANIEGIELTLQPPGEIQGHAIIEGKSDLKDHPQLVLHSSDANFSGRWLRLKDDLTFKIEGLPAGLYDIGTGGAPEDYFVKSVHMGEQDVTESGFDLSPGVHAELTVVLSANGGLIEGSVQTAKDQPASSATVTLIPAAGHKERRPKTANTDQNGRFTIKGVAPGEYKIYAWEEIESGAYEDPDFMNPHESEGESVSIKERGHETVQLKLIPAESSAAKPEH